MKMKFILLVYLAFVTFIAKAITRQDVSFTNGQVQLKGTLYLPKGDGPFPAIVFVHGSGPETRHNSKFSAKWFASIGYAALTYDKRGTGESDGKDTDWSRFNIDDLANDVVAAVEFLHSLRSIDGNKIGLHSVSQGGWIAPLAAKKSNKISFMIIKSASVTTIEEDRVFERSTRLKKEGFSDESIQEAMEIQAIEAVPADSKDEFSDLFLKYSDREWLPTVYGSIKDPRHPSLIAYREWYATICDFDPIALLNQLAVPIFWIFGDPMLDELSPVNTSIANVKNLKSQGKQYEIQIYSGQDHNIKESAYERTLFDWLIAVNNYSKYKFKKH